MKNSLKHISFIMDGNNRWSNKSNKTKFYTYKKGANNLLKISKFIFDKYNTKYISAFALSNKNLQRSKSFNKIFLNVLNYCINEFNPINHNFRLKFIGDLSFLDFKLRKKINDIELKNKSSKFMLIIFLNYSGKHDIHCASKKLKKTNSNYSFDKLLFTKDIPDPDILIRTGGYKRISDFLLYQLSFTELFFSKKLWPNYNLNDVDSVIKKYFFIERKFGV